MRKLSIIYMIFMIVVTAADFMPHRQTSSDMAKAELFFVDAHMMRLVSIDYYITDTDAEKQAKIIVTELIKGRDGNDVIRRLIPNHKDALSVKLKDEVAVVDVNMKYLDEYETGKLQEELFVYQIVNSLCSLDGINRVKFTFDGEQKKNFIGDMDMREAYVPDYYV